MPRLLLMLTTTTLVNYFLLKVTWKNCAEKLAVVKTDRAVPIARQHKRLTDKNVTTGRQNKSKLTRIN